MEVVASLSLGRTAAAQCGLFTRKSVPVTFEPPCIYLLNWGVLFWLLVLLLIPSLWVTFRVHVPYLILSSREYLVNRTNYEARY